MDLLTRLVVSGTLMAGSVLAACNPLDGLINSNKEIEGTKLIIPEPIPTPTLDLPLAVDVMEIRQHIDRFGVCPSPEKIGNLRIANPQIVGGVCPGE